MFMTVCTPSSRRTGATCRIAGCMSGANMNTIPASRSAAAMTFTGASIATPRASSTSALPHCVVNERFPCFATRTPAAGDEQRRGRGDIEGVDRSAAGAAGVDQLVRTLGRQHDHRLLEGAHDCGELRRRFLP